MKSRNTPVLSLALFLVCCLMLTCPIQGAGASETRLIVDQVGREVVIPNTVNRIITTWQPATCMVFAVGGQSKLVASRLRLFAE
jgi:ABC-type Fe3+-hydroxamate transport system substrate-binding protein